MRGPRRWRRGLSREARLDAVSCNAMIRSSRGEVVLALARAEELLAVRHVEVDHVTIYRLVQTFTLEFIDAARPARATQPVTVRMRTRRT